MSKEAKAPIDPNVRIPPAVVAASARATELSAQFSQDNLAKAAIEYENQSTAEKAGRDEPKPVPPPAQSSPTSESKATAPEAPPTPASAPPPHPPADWENRYNAMKGRYDSETKRLSTQVGDMQRLLAAMQSAPPQNTSQAQQPADTRFVTPKEEEEYGKEFLDVVGRRAQEIATAQNKELRFELDGLKKQVSGVHQTTLMNERDKLFSTLDHDIPNWRELNDSTEFHSWLRLPDAYSSVIRQELLMSAFNSNQVGRVAAFFRGFLADEAATRPVDPLPTPSAQAPSRLDLRTLAAPGRAKQAAANPPVEKPIVTRSEIAQFYADVNRGVYLGRDADKIVIEKQIFDAQREGRIR